MKKMLTLFCVLSISSTVFATDCSQNKTELLRQGQKLSEEAESLSTIITDKKRPRNERVEAFDNSVELRSKAFKLSTEAARLTFECE